ncbi:MAG: flagellar export chaperone FlgN [Candidatus Zixiibacteriota bacterium]
MEPLVKKLLEVIAQETKLLESFLAVLADQENLLLNHKLSSLSRSWEKEKESLSLAKSLERKRLNITQKLSQKLKIERNKFNFSLLSELLEESCCTRLEELQRILLDLYKKVELQWKKNQRLIRKSSGFLVSRKDVNSPKSIPGAHPVKPTFHQRKISLDFLSKKAAAN